MSVSAITSDRILKLGYSYRASKALLSAVELDVFTALAGRRRKQTGAKALSRLSTPNRASSTSMVVRQGHSESGAMEGDALAVDQLIFRKRYLRSQTGLGHRSLLSSRKTRRVS